MFFLEIDILDAFDLKNGLNGIEKSITCGSGPSYIFRKTPKEIKANKEITNEFLELISRHRELIITLHVRPMAYNKGTLLWLQKQRTGMTTVADNVSLSSLTAFIRYLKLFETHCPHLPKLKLPKSPGAADSYVKDQVPGVG